MRLIVQKSEDGFRAWLRERFLHPEAIVTAMQIELPGVNEVIGWDVATARRMGWPDDVFVRWERGSVTFPRDLVDVLPPAQAALDDGRTVEGQA